MNEAAGNRPEVVVERSFAVGAFIKDLHLPDASIDGGAVHVLLHTYPEVQPAVVDVESGAVEPLGPTFEGDYNDYWWGADRQLLLLNAQSEFLDERHCKILVAKSFASILARRESTIIAMSAGGLAALEAGDPSSPGDARVEVWNGHTGELMLTIDEGLQHFAAAIAFAPDETELAILERRGKSSIITRWRLADGGQIATYELANQGSSWGISYSPNGDRLVAAVTDPRDTVLEWDLAGGNGNPTKTYPHHDGGSIFVPQATSASYSPSGELLIATGGKAITVWNTRTGELVGVHQFRGPLASVRPLADDSGMVIARNDKGNGTVEVLRYP